MLFSSSSTILVSIEETRVTVHIELTDMRCMFNRQWGSRQSTVFFYNFIRYLGPGGCVMSNVTVTACLIGSLVYNFIRYLGPGGCVMSNVTVTACLIGSLGN